MPEFTYTARDTTGEKVTGAVTAATQKEALASIAGKALFPIEVSADKAPVQASRIRRVPAQLRATTFSQLADLLQSGVPLLRALKVLQKQTTHTGLITVLDEIQREVEDGGTLGDAMAKFPTVFGEMAVSMVRAGGEGGFLEEALSRVAEFTEAQDDLTKRTTGALAYPCVLAVIGSIVVTVLLVYFVPQFENLFQDLRDRGELPLLTEMLLITSDLLWERGLYALVGLGVAGWFIRQWAVTDAGRYTLDRIKLRLPLVGPVFLSLAVARFCRVLGTLLNNGVPILRSLEISSDATANRVLAGAIQQATENISAGESLAEPLARSGHFPVTVVEMISVAEESNTLENVLLNIADSLERTTWRQLDLAVRLIEPLMLLILASVVLMLVIALLLPVMKMSQTL